MKRQEIQLSFRLERHPHKLEENNRHGKCYLPYIPCSWPLVAHANAVWHDPDSRSTCSRATHSGNPQQIQGDRQERCKETGTLRIDHKWKEWLEFPANGRAEMPRLDPRAKNEYKMHERQRHMRTSRVFTWKARTYLVAGDSTNNG